jgi:hypothetical protein
MGAGQMGPSDADKLFFRVYDRNKYLPVLLEASKGLCWVSATSLLNLV